MTCRAILALDLMILMSLLNNDTYIENIVFWDASAMRDTCPWDTLRCYDVWDAPSVWIPKGL